MRSTYVARDASVAMAAAEPAERRVWEVGPSTEAPAYKQPSTEDDLRPARGILTAVLAGVAIWIGLGWGAMILIDRMLG